MFIEVVITRSTQDRSPTQTLHLFLQYHTLQRPEWGGDGSWVCLAALPSCATDHLLPDVQNGIYF